MKSHLVDFHCHLDLFPDFPAAVAAAETAAVYTLAVTTTPKAWPRNSAVTSRTRYVRAALGLHPQLVDDRAGEVTLWEEFLSQTRYVGEVGLDAGPRYYHSLGVQKRVFERILRACADAGGKILTVHTVRSASIVLDMIDALLPRDRGKVVLHWFSGSSSEAKRAVDLGCYFSINAEMMVRDRGRKLVSQLPTAQLLTETDGPFTQVSGHAAGPSDVNVALELLANLHNTSPEDMASVVETNLRTLLSDDGDPSCNFDLVQR